MIYNLKNAYNTKRDVRKCLTKAFAISEQDLNTCNIDPIHVTYD